MKSFHYTPIATVPLLIIISFIVATGCGENDKIRSAGNADLGEDRWITDAKEYPQEAKNG